MTECDYCQHVEMCRWLKDVEEQGCEFFDDGNKWIPVSERLPEAYQMVLVTYEEFHWANEPVTYGVKLIPFGGRVDFIAWMPLPKPYEQQESEE